MEEAEQPTAYIIGRNSPTHGLFALVNAVVYHSLFAKSLGYIPVVDMLNYENQYFKDNRKFKDNTWEYFFEQPAGYMLEDTKNMKTVFNEKSRCPDIKFFISSDDIPTESFSANDSENPHIIELKNEYKNILRFKPDIKKYLETNLANKIKDRNKTLGILCRGTDYLKRKTPNDNITPAPETVITKVKEILEKYPDIKYLYLATEDLEIYQMFEQEFGEMLVENTQYMFGNNYDKKKYLAQINVNRKDHAYNLAKEYLLSIYILSKCKYFIGSRTAGTKWAWILSDGWDYCYCWNLGVYKHSLFRRILYAIFATNNLYIDNQKYKQISILGFSFKFKVSMNKLGKKKIQQKVGGGLKNYRNCLEYLAQFWTTNILESISMLPDLMYFKCLV